MDLKGDETSVDDFSASVTNSISIAAVNSAAEQILADAVSNGSIENADAVDRSALNAMLNRRYQGEALTPEDAALLEQLEYTSGSIDSRLGDAKAGAVSAKKAEFAGAAEQQDIYHYNMRVFKRFDDGSLGEVTFRTLTKEEADRIYQLVASDLVSAEKFHSQSVATAQKVYGRGKVVLGSREDLITYNASELDLDGAVVYAGDQAAFQGAGVAFQERNWGGHADFENTRGRNLVLGVGSRDVDNRRLCVGRLYLSDIDSIAVESADTGSVSSGTYTQQSPGVHFQATYVQAQKASVNAFAGLRDRDSDYNLEAGAVGNYLAGKWFTGGGGLVRTSVESGDFDRANFMGYFADRTLMRYVVASGAFQNAQNEQGQTELVKNLSAGGRYMLGDIFGMDVATLTGGGAIQDNSWNGGYLSLRYDDQGRLWFNSYEARGLYISREQGTEAEQFALGLAGIALEAPNLDVELYATSGQIPMAAELKLHFEPWHFVAGAGDVGRFGRGIWAGASYRQPEFSLSLLGSVGAELQGTSAITAQEGALIGRLRLSSPVDEESHYLLAGYSVGRQEKVTTNDAHLTDALQHTWQHDFQTGYLYRGDISRGNLSAGLQLREHGSGLQSWEIPVHSTEARLVLNGSYSRDLNLWIFDSFSVSGNLGVFLTRSRTPSGLQLTPPSDVLAQPDIAGALQNSTGSERWTFHLNIGAAF